MSETIQLGEIAIRVTRKDIKNVHLSVHPPDGRVTLTAPSATRLDVARAYAISRLGWIRQQQEKLKNQPRETPRRFIERESHYLWGRRHLLSVAYREAKPSVSLDHKRITLTVRPGSDSTKRAEVMHEWHKSLLHEIVPVLIKKWEPKLKVHVSSYFLQRMKTKWGSCNPRQGHIRLNTELVKKPKDLIEYVIVHEMVHLIEPVHSDRFIAILQEHYPTWHEARAELNELPLSAEVWKQWFVYMLRCSNGCLYTGITTDVQGRLKVHNAGKGSAYVRAHRPAKLVAFTASENRASASRLEYSVKSLSRAQKIVLARKWKAGQ